MLERKRGGQKKKTKKKHTYAHTQRNVYLWGTSHVIGFSKMKIVKRVWILALGDT